MQQREGEGDLATQEFTKKMKHDPHISSLLKYLDPKLVLFFHAHDRDEALQLLVKKLGTEKRIPTSSPFLNAITEREKIVSTGIGMGVAIPHAKLTEFKQFFIAIGILDKGIDWGALDGAPVRLIFMIGGPDNKQTEYLQILSGITLALKNETRRKKMIAATSPSDIIQLFEEI